MLVFLGRLNMHPGKLVERMMAARNNQIDKEYFLHLSPPTHETVFTPKKLCNGFAGANLKPFNQDYVLEKNQLSTFVCQ
jgi:hypothetical protein